MNFSVRPVSDRSDGGGFAPASAPGSRQIRTSVRSENSRADDVLGVMAVARQRPFGDPRIGPRFALNLPSRESKTTRNDGYRPKTQIAFVQVRGLFHKLPAVSERANFVPLQCGAERRRRSGRAEARRPNIVEPQPRCFDRFHVGLGPTEHEADWLLEAAS